MLSCIFNSCKTREGRSKETAYSHTARYLALACQDSTEKALSSVASCLTSKEQGIQRRAISESGLAHPREGKPSDTLGPKHLEF